MHSKKTTGTAMILSGILLFFLPTFAVIYGISEAFGRMQDAETAGISAVAGGITFALYASLLSPIGIILIIFGILKILKNDKK